MYCRCAWLLQLHTIKVRGKKGLRVVLFFTPESCFGPFGGWADSVFLHSLTDLDFFLSSGNAANH